MIKICFYLCISTKQFKQQQFKKGMTFTHSIYYPTKSTLRVIKVRPHHPRGNIYPILPLADFILDIRTCTVFSERFYRPSGNQFGRIHGLKSRPELIDVFAFVPRIHRPTPRRQEWWLILVNPDKSSTEKHTMRWRKCI